MTEVVLRDEELVKLFELSKLEVGSVDMQKLKTQLSDVLSFVSVLNVVDTSGVEDTAEVTGLSNVYSKDEGVRTLNSSDALQGAVSANNGYFVVKGVFAEDDNA